MKKQFSWQLSHKKIVICLNLKLERFDFDTNDFYYKLFF